MGSEYGNIPYEVDEITAWLETWLNDNMPGLLEDLILPPVFLDFWSATLGITPISSTISSPALNNVVIPDLGSYTILAAYAMMSIDALGATSANETYLNTVTKIQVDKDAAGWIDGLSMVAYSLRIPASTTRTRRFAAVGHYDISSRVANNATTNFRWKDAKSNADNLNVIGIRTGVRLIIG